MAFTLSENDFIKFTANGLIFIGAALVSSGMSSGLHFVLPAGEISYTDVFLAAGLLTHVGSGLASWWAAHCLQ